MTESLGIQELVDLRDVEFRVKSFESIERKFLDEAAVVGESVEGFAVAVNDVLRFSFSMPGGEFYKPALEAILARLTSLGFDAEDDSCKNFWHPGNRFYGFNCTMRSPSGQVFELQLHSNASREAWLRTHQAYGVLRRESEPSFRRLPAFLEMLRVNRESGLPDSVPEGLSLRFPAKDATFAKWISGRQAVWRDYLEWLCSRGESFRDVVAGFGLTADDFPVSEQLINLLEREDVDLLRDIQERRR
ncbi:MULTISPECIES: hypothetical protein [unclassified Micromonospora]|uniref:hypothetical protein n=1 Tax=unclassified Micromonospora TaxID=2617518 RepID=UPI003645AECF